MVEFTEGSPVAAANRNPVSASQTHALRGKAFFAAKVIAFLHADTQDQGRTPALPDLGFEQRTAPPLAIDQLRTLTACLALASAVSSRKAKPAKIGTFNLSDAGPPIRDQRSFRVRLILNAGGRCPTAFCISGRPADALPKPGSPPSRTWRSGTW